MIETKRNKISPNKATFIFVLLYSVIGFRCVKPCHHVKGLASASLTVNFFHQSNNEYFYPSDYWTSPFSKDSLMISDSQGYILRHSYSLNESPVNPLKKFYVIGLGPIFDIQLDKNAFNVESTKFIYIKYNHNTSDTLKLVFKAKKTECADAYDYLKVYRQNNLIASTSDDTGIVFTLNH